MTRLRLRTRLTAALVLVAPVGCYAPVPRIDAPDRSVSRPGPTPSPAREPAPPVTPAAAIIPVIADTAAPLTLEQLEDLAQAHNPILQRDLAKLESARGQALQASLYPNPRFDTNNPEVFAGRNSTYNVGFQQEIVVGGKLRLDTAAAQQQVRQAELVYHQNRLALLTSVRKQYYTVIVGQRRVRVLTQLLDVVRAALETGRKLEKAQEASRIDTLLLTVDFLTVQAKLRQTETLLAGDRKQLAAVVGVPQVETAGIYGDLSARPPDFDEELVRRYAVDGSTLIQFARADITRSHILLRRAIVEPFPNVTVGPAYQFGVVPGSDQFWFNITFPIPTWNRNQGNIRSAVANIRDAEQTLKALQNDQLQKVADALSRYLAARQLVESYEKGILPNVSQAQKLSQEGYAKGVFEFARYLQAQRTVIEANLSYVEALESLWSAAAELAGILQLERIP
jgi:cobalt-zinc-cadmium efflux system outer membrane protein